MVMPASRKRWTASEIHRLSSHRERNEVIGGERFVTPPPSFTHQRAVVSLTAILAAYCESNGVELLVSPAEVRFNDDDRVEPDLFVLPLTQSGKRAGTFADVGRLLLVVEVLSPGTARMDRGRKRELYQAQRVPEYWIVDPERRAFERWRDDGNAPEILTDSVRWKPSDLAEELRIDLVAFFSGVCDG